MDSSINNIDRNRLFRESHCADGRDLADVLKNEQRQFAEEISSALHQLSELDNSPKLREDAIQNGRAIIEHWQPPTNEQIRKIFANIKHEFIKVS